MDQLELDGLTQQSASVASEINTLTLDRQQAHQLHRLAEQVAALGGPQAAGARSLATQGATELKLSLSEQQHRTLRAYTSGMMSALVFDGLCRISDTPPPDQLVMSELENRHDILCLASRSQILLELLEHRAFAYDIDNDGQLVRLVGNFKGGGLQKIRDEPKNPELSSHSGLSLGPHTEAPYWCSERARDGHSPAPSALILSALWNPRMEPTSVIPMPPVLSQLDAISTLALASQNFNFMRSESFSSGAGQDGFGVSILEFSERLGFSVRFNSYRFSVAAEAPTFVKKAFLAFCHAVERAQLYQHVLTQESTLVINNTRAPHCRDAVKDNRRLLIRLFGISKSSDAIVLSNDPLTLAG